MSAIIGAVYIYCLVSAIWGGIYHTYKDAQSRRARRGAATQ